MIMSHFHRLEGKRVDYVDASASESIPKQPQYGMPYNFYENQSMYVVANQAKLAAVRIVTPKKGVN